MREVAKSALSLTWALSLLGVKQAMGVMNPQGTAQSMRAGTNDFEPVAQAAVNQLGQSWQGAFRTGDNLQRGVMNMVFGFGDPSGWNPGRWMPGNFQCPSNCSPSSRSWAGQPSEGWGPVPPRPDAG